MSGGVRRLSWRFVPSSTLTSRAARARHTITKPVLEPLEGRQLLALFTGFSHVRNVPTPTGVYSLQIDGPGVLKTQPAGGGSFDVIVLGTTDASTLMITQVRPRYHVANGLMSIDNLTIRSGQIGSILASPVELDGAMSPVNSSVGTLEFGALGPGAHIDVNGGVNTMDVGSVGSGAQIDVNGSVSTMDLGPVESGAQIDINGSVSTMDVGSVESGAIDVSGNVGTMNIGSVGSGAIDVSDNVGTMNIGSVGSSAQIDVNGSVGTMNLGSVNLGPGGSVVITGDLNSAFESPDQSSTTTGTTIASMNLDGGQFVIGGDSLEPITIAGDLSLSYDGLIAIGRDQTGTLSVGGSVILDSGGQIYVGRNLAALTVGGNVLIGPGASGIVVGGDLDAMNVGGIFVGQGSPSAVDLAVGLNLNGFQILGGTSNLIPGETSNPGGLQSANIKVGKNISGLEVSHGIFLSWITAGVSINGGSAPGSTTVTVGADGVTAIYNSEIDAGASITNVTVGGDVTSGFPTGGTTGYPTRIIAGKVRAAALGSTPDQGVYLPNGSISNLTINGALIDAVLAASVAPFGGDGSLPQPPAYGALPQSPSAPIPGVPINYQAPAGLTTNTTTMTTTPNYSIRNVINGVPTGPAAWQSVFLHDTVLNNGSITSTTITGGVVSTQTNQLADMYDYAGLFAVNTIGVTPPQNG